MDLLNSLQDRLSRALATLPDGSPALTVGELYQRLIPYRTVRNELGVMELAAYEHALLRLLSGEGGYLELEGQAAREEIQRELASPNPILGIYRDYADVAVTVATNGAPRTSAPAPDVSGDPERVPSVTSPSRSVDPPSTHSDRESVTDAHVVRSGAKTPRPQACSRCRSTLPTLAGLRFCPFCGEGREPQPCPRCGTLLELNWNFCIRCGAQAVSTS